MVECWGGIKSRPRTYSVAYRFGVRGCVLLACHFACSQPAKNGAYA